MWPYLWTGHYDAINWPGRYTYSTRTDVRYLTIWLDIDYAIILTSKTNISLVTILGFLHQWNDINRNPAIGAYVRQNFILNYYNKVVHSLHNLIWRSGQASHLIERFGQAHHGSKAHGLTLNLVYLSPQTLFLCKSSYMVFEPYLLCSF